MAIEVQMVHGNPNSLEEWSLRTVTVGISWFIELLLAYTVSFLIICKEKKCFIIIIMIMIIIIIITALL